MAGDAAGVADTAARETAAGDDGQRSGACGGALSGVHRHVPVDLVVGGSGVLVRCAAHDGGERSGASFRDAAQLSGVCGWVLRVSRESGVRVG